MEHTILIPCAKCGHLISPVASTCPKCNWGRFQGKLCGELIPKSELVVGYHRRYLAPRIPGPLRCVHCHVDLEQIGLNPLNDLVSVCPSWGGGGPLPIHICINCQTRSSPASRLRSWISMNC